MEKKRPVSAWWYILGGCVVGVGIGLLISPDVAETLLEAQDRVSPEEGQTVVSRLLKLFPFRVKAAGAAGAVKGASRKAYQMARSGREEAP